MSSTSKKTDIEQRKNLQRFLKLVDSAVDTPGLIQQIARERFFMKCCAAVAKADPYKSPELWRLYGQIQEEAGRQLRSLERIRHKLVPVAAALGLGQDSSQNRLQVDYYQLLGVDRTADQETIKKAFRKQARQVHPDVSSGEEDRFLAVHEAYEVLSDPALRRHYDDSRGDTARAGWTESADPQQMEGRNKHSALRRYGYQLAAIVVLLIGVSIAADQMIRDESLNQSVRMPTDTAETDKDPSPTPSEVRSGTKPQPASVMELADLEPIPEPVGTKILEPVVPRVQPPAPLRAEMDQVPPAAAEKPESKVVQKRVQKSKPAESKPVVAPAPEPAEAEPEKKTRPKAAPTADRPTATAKTGLDEKQAESMKTVASEKQPEDIVPDKAPSPPPPPPAQKEAVVNELELLEKLNEFLDHYCKTYEARDFGQFMEFFSESATENGTPVFMLADQYRSNFNQLAAIEYDIDMVRYSWNLSRKQAEVQGAFTLKWRKNEPDGSPAKWNTYSGKVEMLLDQKGKTFLVQKLNYRFDE